MACETAKDVYITDALRVLTENTAQSESRKWMDRRYYDLLFPPKEEKRTGAEIVNTITRKLEALKNERI